MPTSPWTAEHDRLLRRAVPVVAEPLAVEVDRVWNRVSAVVADVGPSRRRRRRITAAFAIGAAVLGTSSFAAADLYTAHTGKGPIDAEDVRLAGPGERLDPAAPDYGAVVSQETKDIPFPTAAARGFAVRDQVRDARDATPRNERVAVGALRGYVADAALCAWSNQWAVATRDHAASARAESIRVIRQAPTWPAVTALDPHPYSRTQTLRATDALGSTSTRKFRDNSQFYYLAELGEAVGGTDPQAVAEVLAENNGYCRAGLVPDLPQADPMYPGY